MAEIKFLPVCSKCRAILDLFTVCVLPGDNIEQIDDGYHKSQFLISPSVCPFCESHFDAIRMQTRLPFYGRSLQYHVEKED